MNNIEIKTRPDFVKMGGLIPVIIQDYTCREVLMLGYMNEEAYNKTIEEGIVTFYSRSRNSLWTKGETSGNFLKVKDIHPDCDSDSLLILVMPDGPVCHTGSRSCFDIGSNKGVIYQLEKTIQDRVENGDNNSYTKKLYERGINKIAQKVGEEAVELVIEAMGNNIDLFKNEAADLLYHFLVLLHAKNVTIEEVETVLKEREKK